MTRQPRFLRPLLSALVAVSLFASACGDDEAANQPPKFIGVDAEYRTQVDQPVRIEVSATDPEGERVTLTMDKGPEGAQFVAPDALGLFYWAPISSDAEAGGKSHDVIFAAVDARGGRATLKTTIIVEPTDGAPRFVTSNQRVLDLSRNPELVAEVKVKDDDSTRVELTLRDAPDGMELVQLEDKSAELRWTPNEQQVQKKLVWGATLVADDGASPAVEQNLSVILVSKACGESGVAIMHTPLGEQRGIGEYVVDVTIPAAGATDAPTLFWRKGGDPNDSGGFEGVAMASSGGGHYTGTIPNPLLPAGKTDDIYYFVVSVSSGEEASAEVCTNRAPDKGLYSFTAFPPGDTSCRMDSYEPNDTTAAAPTLEIDQASGFEAYNLSLCDGDRDLYAIELAEGEGASALIVFREDDGVLALKALGTDGSTMLAESNSTVQDEAFLLFAGQGAGKHYLEVTGDRNSYSLFVVVREGIDASCVDTMLEPNDSPTSAIILEAGTYDGLKLCSGDLDYFGVRVPPNNTLRVRARFSQSQGDIDLFLRDDRENVVARAVSATDNEELVFINDTAVSSFTLQARTYDDNPKDYSLELEITEGGADVCSRDFMEPNNTAEEARQFAIEGGLSGFSATMCGDDDFYAFTATAGDPITSQIRFDPNTLDLDMALLGPNMQAIDRSEGIEGTEAVSATAATTGIHWVHVYRYANDQGTGPYTLDLSAGAAANNGGNNANNPNSACRIEAQEPNDAIAVASFIEGDQVDGLGLCADELDWWVLSANAGQDLLIDVIPEGTDGGTPFDAILVELYESDGATLLDTGVQVNQTISVGTSNTRSDIYLLRIQNIDDLHFYNYRIEAIVF